MNAFIVSAYAILLLIAIVISCMAAVSILALAGTFIVNLIIDLIEKIKRNTKK
jgi:hypothetical protein